MALLPPNTDYTDKDFASLRERLFELIQSVFPEWTDRNVSNFGNILIELFSFTGDFLTFYQDNQAREARITTATQRKSLLGLVKLLNFTPSTASASQATLLITTPPMAGDIIINNGDVFYTQEVVDPVAFQVVNPDAPAYVIPAGVTAINVTVENSEPAQDTVASSGLPFLTFPLSETPYLDDSLTVVAANGTYEQRANLLSSTGSDRHFTVAVDQNDRATIRFGNNINGAIPTGTITATYKTGGGERANVEPNAIRVAGTSYTDTLGTVARLTITNPTKASGGAPRMSNERIAELAPEQLRAPINSIAREDFEINARRLPQVARALHLTRNEDPSIPENTGILYVVPAGGGYPTTDLKNLVHHQVTTVYPCPTTYTLLVRDPVYKFVDVTAIVFLRAGASASLVKAALTANLSAFFALKNPDGTTNTAIDFGFNAKDVDGNPSPSLSWSDVQNVVRDTAGVRKVEPVNGFTLNNERADVALLPREFPSLRNLVLINGDTGSQF